MIGREQLQALWDNLAKLGAKRLAALGLVGAMVLSIVGAASYYLSRPALETLYSGLTAQDIGRVGATLKEAGIDFDVNAAGNAVLVPYGQTAQARMLLAERGLPSSTTSGYELFDKMGSMGLTSFMQEVTRVRALEGEIARTIQAMRNIKAARVHLVMGDGGSYRRKQEKPTASVVIRSETTADAATAQAIRHMVAAAVPGLEVEQVTVLSTDGTLLASGGDAATAAPGKMLGLEQVVSTELQSNVQRTLAPYLGTDNFQVSVAARLNTDKRQVNETIFDPNSKVERSVRVIKETGSSLNQTGQPAVGVEQNAPPDEETPVSSDQSTKKNDRKEELTNFEVNSKQISTVSDGYRIEALTVAVVVNRKRLVETLGPNPAPEAIEAQLKQVEQLVGTAVGTNEQRGDKITVMAVDFLNDGQPLAPVASLDIAEHVMRQLGSLVGSGTMLAVTLLMIFMVLRPVTRELLAVPEAPAAAEGSVALNSEQAAIGSDGSPMQAQIGGGGGNSSASLLEDLTIAVNRLPMRKLEQIVDQDEEQAAAILKQWLRESMV